MYKIEGSELPIPNSIIEIGEYVFFRCPNLTVKCYPSSHTEQYCKGNKINYELIKEEDSSIKSISNLK